MTDMCRRLWCEGGALMNSLRQRGDKGSVTMENVIWALAVIVIAAIVVAAITSYVTSHSSDLLGP
ncbi:MAG: hypothetical protein FWD55_03140 [Propionibacteriaceae bacterium]|nr:hypothetical protein [Propionibacteriaceae bacterium]